MERFAEASTKAHLADIDLYSKELDAFIAQMDERFKALANQSHVKLFRDYE